MLPRILDISGNRLLNARNVTHSRANPLTLRLTPDPKSAPIAGAALLRAELRASETDTGDPLATTEIPDPAGSGPWDLALSGAQLNQDLGGMAQRSFWLVVYFLHDDGQRDTQYTAHLQIREDNASLSSAMPPVVEVLLNRSEGDGRYKARRYEVESIGGLRALDVSSAVQGEIAQAAGYYAPLDGGGGRFRWNPASTAADDGGTVIRPSGVTGAGRFERDFPRGETRAAWWGVRPNTTDDQSALLTYAMQRTAELGSGNCRLDAGVYRIYASLYVPAQVNLHGQGKRVTILQQQPNIPQNEARSLIELGDPAYNSTTPRPVRRNTIISGIGFDLFNNPSAKGIRLRFEVEDVTIKDCRCWLSDVEAGNPRTNGGDRHFIDLSVTGPTGETLPDAVGIRSLKILGCEVDYGVQLTSNAGRGVSVLWVKRCLISNPIAYGLALTSVGTNVDFTIENVIITDNVFKNVDTGVILGRDRTGQGNLIHMYQRTHQARNITIANNQFIMGATYANPSAIACAINIGTYQTFCGRIKIHGNTITRRDGLAANETVGIKFELYGYNWETDLMGGTLPTIAAVDTALDTLTTSKPARLYTGMAVRFERTNADDTLPAPLLENRRYRILNQNPIDTVLDNNGNVTTADTNTIYKLTDFRTGTVINLTSAGSGAVKVIFSPCVEDVTVQDNTISGMSTALWVTDCHNLLVRGNLFVRGGVRSTASGLLERVKFLDNVMDLGTYQFDGRVTDGLIRRESWQVRDDALGISNLAAFWFNPVQTFAAQAWRIEDNTVDLTRNDGNAGYRLTAAFRRGGAGEVRITSLKRNGVSPVIGRPFEDLDGADVKGIHRNFKLGDPAAAFTPTPLAILSRIVADSGADLYGLRETQSDTGLTGRDPIGGGVFFEGTPGSQMGYATLTGVNLGTEGRGLTWRHRVGASSAIGGLWALTASATAGHAANALYAFEANGIITIRQVGSVAGNLDAATGAVTGGYYRQATFDASGRRGFPAHFTASIDRLGTLLVWMDGLPVKLTETTAGTAPAWNNTLAASPVLTVGYVDTSAGSSSFPGFKGAFYSLAVLNFAPTDSQAQALFAGGTNALPGYGLRNPADNVSNGGFADASNWSPQAGVTISGGACNFLNVAAGVGVNQATVQYRKGRIYRLGINILSYTSGQLYVPIGANPFRTAWTPTVGLTVFEGEIPAADNAFGVRAWVGSTTLSIDDVSMVPLGAVASYEFDSGVGYQVEDKAGLANHLRLNGTAGAYHLVPRYSSRWTGRLTADGTFNGGRMMETPGHVITRISAYSALGGQFRMGDSSGAVSTLVATVTIPAGVWTDLTLLKNSTTAGSIYADLITNGMDLQITVEFSVPRLLL